MSLNDIPSFIHFKKTPDFENHLTKLGLSWNYAKELSQLGINTLRQLFDYYNNKNPELEKVTEEYENIQLKLLFEKLNIDSDKIDKIIEIIRNSDQYYVNKDIDAIIQQYDISDLYQMGLSKELSDKLMMKAFYDLNDLYYYGDYVDILTYTEFIELICFLMEHGVIESEEINDFTVDLSKEAVNKICRKLEHIEDISLENLKMRIYLSYLYLEKKYKPIMKAFILNPHITVTEMVDSLQVENHDIYFAYNQFVKILKNPIKQKTLEDYI